MSLERKLHMGKIFASFVHWCRPTGPKHARKKKKKRKRKTLSQILKNAFCEYSFKFVVKILVNLLKGKKCLNFTMSFYKLSSPLANSEYKMEMINSCPKSKGFQHTPFLWGRAMNKYSVNSSQKLCSYIWS